MTMSPYSNPEFYIPSFFGTYTDTELGSDTYGESFLNVFNPTMLDIAKSMRSGIRIIYSGETMQALSLKVYNTTSGWWVILFANGFAHESLIPLGMPLFIPDSSVLFSNKLTINTVSDNRKGMVITIR